ncbi:LCP family protein [Streptomyces sp. H10-C2]|uniref:LCP family protein n=1 Tax=unclassified Streptomyces TaxID=2593676 RepID=UPI0024BA0BD9|nr:MULTISPECIES: LCP family protein [unclassified Streptomyces]MDJ0341265.1 LCP family protein [Streptomyces sp. PH10-H1]MDJ0370860.1 LCP family protein [Streptomyces sp. H10-C2]
MGADVTTPAGTPATPPDPDDASSTGEGVGGADTPPAAPAARKGRRWLRVLAACTAVVLLAGAGTAWYLYKQLDGNIKTDVRTANELERFQSERPTPGPTKAENILLIGSDNRGNGNSKYGQDSGTQRSDTTILLHLSSDRRSATAVSIPRDLMSHVPSCKQADGTMSQEKFIQFNWAFEFGGAACTIRTMEKMTGIRIDHHMIVDFNGFKKMVDAMDGVEVCLPKPINDQEAHLNLPAGVQTLNGEQALGFVRARYSLGDGSDTQRMDRQQEFLASLVHKIRSDGVLLNPTKLYPVLSAATSSLTVDAGLDSLSKLYDLARSLENTPTGAVHFLTAPRQPYAYDKDRDELVQPEADQLFAALRADRPVSVTTKSGDGTRTGGPADGNGARDGWTFAATTPPGPGAGPTFPGTTAERDICGKAQ